jgi:hypothetical protein
LKLFLILLQFSTILAFGQSGVGIDAISFKMGDRWVTGADLDARAAGFISAADKEFRRDGLRFKLFVFPESEAKRYLFVYHLGLGKKMWSIYASKDGAFSNYQTGIARDSESHPGFGENFQKFQDAIKEIAPPK